MPRTIDEIFADRLAAELAVRPHGYQTDLAAAVGISKSRLNNLLKGRRGSTEDVRRDICRELGREYDEFLFGEQQPAAKVDPLLEEFLSLYSRYGSPAFLEVCIKKLQAIKEAVEGSQ